MRDHSETIIMPALPPCWEGWETTVMTDHADDRPLWDYHDDRPPQWETNGTRNHPEPIMVTGHPNERPLGWETTLRLSWWQTTLMRDHPIERTLIWEATLMTDHWDDIPPWWETTEMRSHPQTIMMTDHPDEWPLGWEATIMRDHLMTDHWDKRPLWWETTLTERPPSENTAIQYFHWTFWLMMIYHQVMFICKWIVSSEGIAETVVFWWLLLLSFLYTLPVTLTVRTTTQCFLHDTLTLDDAPPHQHWLQKVKWFFR